LELNVAAHSPPVRVEVEFPAIRFPQTHVRGQLSAAPASPASPEGIRKNRLLSEKTHRAVPVDGNGNVRALVQANTANPAANAVVERYSYDGFGRELAGSTPAASSVNSYRFSTKQADAETGMNYYGYRYYAADMGRWINRDPIEEGSELNVYLMAGNDVVFNWDINGLLVIYTSPDGGTTVSAGGPPDWTNFKGKTGCVQRPARRG